MKPANAIAVGLAFLVGACAVFVFLTQNDPDTVSEDVTSRFGWLVLAPGDVFTLPGLASLIWFERALYADRGFHWRMYSRSDSTSPVEPLADCGSDVDG